MYRFAGFFALPHFLDGEEGFNATKKLLLPVIEKALRRMEERNRLDAPWIMVDAVPKERPQCEYIVYAQIHPVAAPKDERKTPITADVLRTIETELRFPTGQTLPPTPPLQVTAMIYSPNCGFVLMAPEMRGKKAEEFNAQSSHFGLAGAAVAAAQIWLLIRQMNESNTLSTVSRVSFWTIAMMWVVDGYFFFSFLFVAMFMPASFLPMAAGSFCYLMITAQFGIRFLVATYRVQRQSRGAAAVAPPAADGGLPMQETATVIPANQPANRDDDANYDVGIMQIRFYFTLMAMLLLTLHSTTWPQVLRNLLMDFTLLLTNSYWLPQVWRNVMRGCRKAFRWEFVFGTSILRLAAVAYFYLYDDNIFKIPRNPALVGIVAGWVTVQCLLLIVQDVLGPRFLLPAASLPPVYDYHPSLGADDEEAAQDMGTRTESGGRSFDCVVCMQTVEIPRAGSEEVGLLGRRGYMVTPCKHVFHSHCLEGWMRFRLQCPICRNPLPAL